MPTELFELVMEEKITTYLLLMKICPNLQGFKFILYSVKMILGDISKKRSINNILYGDIAYDFNLGRASIDGALRHLIEISAKRDGLKNFVKDYDFIIKGERPTPKELLSALAIKLQNDKDICLLKK